DLAPQRQLHDAVRFDRVPVLRVQIDAACDRSGCVRVTDNDGRAYHAERSQRRGYETRSSLPPKPAHILMRLDSMGVEILAETAVASDVGFRRAWRLLERFGLRSACPSVGSNRL